MKLNPTQIQAIKSLIAEGLPSRKIAKQLGVSKSTVNNHRDNSFWGNFNPFVTNKSKFNPKVPYRMTFFDLESAPDTVVSFSRFNANFTQDHVLNDGGYLLSVAWATNNGEVEVYSLTPEEAVAGDDKRLVSLLYLKIEESDIAVTHNLHRFDWPLFLARCAVHGFSAPHKVQKIDTLRMAKQMRFQSNRLGSLAKFIGCEAKIDTGGIQLWINCMNGDKKALKEMREYNAGDVVTLREVYHKLKTVANTGVNLGIYYDDGQIHCPTCGSSSIELENTNQSNLSVYDEYYCTSCGSNHRSRKAINRKEHRNLQLT